MTIGLQVGVALATVLLASCATGGDGGLEVTAGEAQEASTATEGRVELKLVIEPADIRKARYRFGVFNAGSETRNIWFYDTPWLDVFEGGAILRAREIDGDEDDSTIKLRPFEASDLDPAFLALDDTKCEIDRGLSRSTPNCSMSVDQEEGEIAEVGAGERGIDHLLSSEQEEMYAAYGPGIGLDELVALGPIPARVWTLKTDELPAKATVELWYLPDASQVLEVSLKVPAGDADAAFTALQDFVAVRGLRLASDQESKTRTALELLSDYGWY